jgi:hypothetical protein
LLSTYYVARLEFLTAGLEEICRPPFVFHSGTNFRPQRLTRPAGAAPGSSGLPSGAVRYRSPGCNCTSWAVP